MLQTQKKSVRVGKLVNTDHVNEVIRNYKQERWIHNSKRLGKEDSLSVWYSVEELEEFMTKIKDHGGGGGCLFFCAYYYHYTKKTFYARGETIFFVATKKKKKGKRENKKEI